MNRIAATLLCTFLGGCMANPVRIRSFPSEDSPYLRDLLNGPEFAPFRAILDDPVRHRLQILVTEIAGDGNRLVPVHHGFRLRPQEYFYPASMVKVPVALLALEKLDQMGIPEIDLDTSYRLEPGDCQDEDLGPSTVRRDIVAMFAVSDNEAFDRLYSFLGQDYMMTQLRHKGYRSVQITHRLAAKCSMEQNRRTNSYVFEDSRGNPLFREQSRITRHIYRNQLDGMDVVNGYEGSERSFISLADMHRLTMAAVTPELLSESSQFQIPGDARKLLLRAMSTAPEETDLDFDSADHQGSTGKFLVLGGSRDPIPSQFTIFNKVGKALGFLTDSAVIWDKESGTATIMTATVYVNYNHSAVDEAHHYKDLGLPFLATLGRSIVKSQSARQKLREFHSWFDL